MHLSIFLKQDADADAHLDALLAAMLPASDVASILGPDITGRYNITVQVGEGLLASTSAAAGSSGGSGLAALLPLSSSSSSPADAPALLHAGPAALVSGKGSAVLVLHGRSLRNAKVFVRMQGRYLDVAAPSPAAVKDGHWGGECMRVTVSGITSPGLAVVELQYEQPDGVMRLRYILGSPASRISWVSGAGQRQQRSPLS